ncbi:MAG: hypothetical protein ACRDPT_03850, partial [Streptomycetales bacterium]
MAYRPKPARPTPGRGSVMQRRRRRDEPPVVALRYERDPQPLAVVEAVRGVWRYRSELGPFAGAAGLFVSGASLHASHPELWP